MKLLLVILAAILAIALSASTVKSAGISLSWDDCGAHGVLLRTFACDTNEGSHTLVGSFVAPAGVDSMSANEIVMDLESAEHSLPGWAGSAGAWPARIPLPCANSGAAPPRREPGPGVRSSSSTADLAPAASLLPRL